MRKGAGASPDELHPLAHARGSERCDQPIVSGLFLQETILHYLIIGGGPAGLTAAATLRRIDEQSGVTILSKENHPPYARIALPYLLTRAVEEKLLFLPMAAGVSLILADAVVEVDPEKHAVRTASGNRFFFDKLLIATGASPIRPPIEGIDLPFVTTIRDLPDVRAVQDLLKVRKTGHCVVAGAGPVGLELSDALHKMGLAVTLVISSDRVFSTMLDTATSALLEKKLGENGVEVRKNTDIARICPSGEVLLSSGESRFCDVVIVGKGVAPTLDFLARSGIGMRRGILVDEHQETNIPGIYAAGDVAETRDIVYEDFRVNALWPVAFEQGKVAAYNMAAHALAYEGSFSRNILRVFDTSILAAGMAMADAPEVHSEDGPDFRHKVVLDKGILKGFAFVGETRNAGLYNDLLRRRVQVASCARSLLRGSYDYAQFLKKNTKQ
jgi:NADPH-dependent 2,4-dienoyl-CoA reductase/sulfur reductase-like enzyme